MAGMPILRACKGGFEAIMPESKEYEKILKERKCDHQR